MWAVENPASVRALLDRGGDVNVTSEFGRTPLLIAAQVGALESVTLLLGRGPTPTPATLAVAANRQRADIMRRLIAAGARDAGGAAAANARRNRCADCAAALTTIQPAAGARASLLAFIPPGGAVNAETLAEVIAAGADVNERDAKSRTAGTLAAVDEALPVESVRLLIARGADIHAKDPGGFSMLDWARRLGRTPVVEALVAAGGTEGRAVVTPAISYVTGNDVQSAVRRSLPLLQRTGLQFYERSGCLSCHHNSLTAMTVAAARRKGFPIDEKAAAEERRFARRDIEATREQTLQGIFTPGGAVTTFAYILIGLQAEGHKADAATDSMIRLLRLTQYSDGRWRSAYRPPLESSLFTTAATAMRSMQLYGSRNAEDGAAIERAASWIAATPAVSTEDHVFRLFGLTWANAPATARDRALRALKGLQRADGGWAQLATLESDAYATGSALVALHEAGLRPEDPAYRRGVQFLLRTQATDGSWFVRSRSHPTQIYFESGFPYGADQYISAAATNWATLALVHAAGSRP
jgi:hypothetical protein